MGNVITGKFLVEKESSLVDVYEAVETGTHGVEFKGFALKCNLLTSDVPRETFPDAPDFMDIYKRHAA